LCLFLSGISAHTNLLKGKSLQRQKPRGRSAREAHRQKQHARKLQQQQSSNQFDACPTQDYIYSGPTMDSIFDELTVQEYQSVTEFVVRWALLPFLSVSGQSLAKDVSSVGCIGLGWPPDREQAL